MKKRFLRILLLAIASSLSAPAFAEPLTSIVFPSKGLSVFDNSVPVPGARVALGDSRQTIKDQLGIPSTTLSPNRWLYENVKVTLPGKAEPLHRNLYVGFSDGKVVDLAIVSDRKRHEMIAEVRYQIIVTAAD